MHLIGWLIGAAIIGAIIGGLARVVMPGHQNISIGMTILLGAIGNILGTWLLSAVTGYDNASGGIPWWGLIAGIVMSIILISIYLSMTGRKGTRV